MTYPSLDAMLLLLISLPNELSGFFVLPLALPWLVEAMADKFADTLVDLVVRDFGEVAAEGSWRVKRRDEDEDECMWLCDCWWSIGRNQKSIDSKIKFICNKGEDWGVVLDSKFDMRVWDRSKDFSWAIKRLSLCLSSYLVSITYLVQY